VGDAVARGGGVALAVRVGADGAATGAPENENGTVVAPVVAFGAGAIAVLRAGLAGGFAGGAEAAVLAPTSLAALSSGKDAVSLVTGAAALMRVRGAASPAGSEATRAGGSDETTRG
jgi:hypothetical protein